MESINKKIIVIAGIFALITSLLIFNYLNKKVVLPKPVETVNVYVAAISLPVKHLILDRDIKLEKIPAPYVNSKAVLNKQDILGKRLKDSIIEGEQILIDRLAQENNESLSYHIPDGKRAVSININEQVGVSNLIFPGDFVDVVASFTNEEINMGLVKKIYPQITKIIIQNVEVIALDQTQVASENKGKDSPKTATLALTPLEAEKLTYASDNAVLRLVLRGVGDTETPKEQGVTRDDLTPDVGVVVPAK
jgi:pilus assembly protein CpaB